MLRVWMLILSILWAVPVFATVPESPSADRYTANGSTTGYPYTFKVYSKTDLSVYVDTALKVLDIDYTVSGVSNEGGGVVTFLAAPGNGVAVTILRNQPQQQFSVYTRSAFSPTQVEKDLDKLTMQVQQLQEQLNRALQFLPSSVATTTVDNPTEGTFARAKVGGGIDWATPAATDPNFSIPISIANGGTGAITAPAALTSLGAAPDAGSTLIEAKGDLLLGTADNTWAKLAMGANGSVLTADSTQSTGARWVAGGAALMSTGDVKYTLKTVADTGWILMDDGTIGNASSGATNRANADTQSLFVLMWDNCPDKWCTVTGGRGASGTDDFAANKPMQIPRTIGRTIAGFHASLGATAKASGTNAAVDTTSNTLTVPANSVTWTTGMPVVFTLTSGTVTGLTSGVTYYIVRGSSTTVLLASSIANAQNGVTIDFTAKSSPVWSITYSSAVREMGENLGEEYHAMSSVELLGHTHTVTNGASVIRNVAGAVAAGGADKGSSTVSISSTGGNTPMNQMQPTVFLNIMMKL